MIPIILVSKSILLVVIDILPFQGSTLSLLVIALIAVIALAIFRFLVPLIIAGIIVILLLVLIFGGIPISISK
ncbi:MAG TPA: hypothetical protein VFU58_06275 [Candidatus Nitrosotalea sp.]|nr:hypothetical protein [Candidatus Nitrosotalea sp.]